MKRKYYKINLRINSMIIKTKIANWTQIPMLLKIVTSKKIKMKKIRFK